MSTDNSNEYLRNQVLTASPEQLHMMLYDGAIRYARQGGEAIERGDIEASYNLLTRAQRIVLEMLSGLRPDVNPQLSAKMASLYNFVYRKLVEASVNRDQGALADALKILEYQRETWAMLMKKIAQQQGDLAEAVAAGAGEGGSFSAEG